MHKEHQIIASVNAAKGNVKKADDLIREYMPFIRKEISKFLSRPCSEQEDHYSIALMAFHEAILGYQKDKGTFLHFASLMIRNRLIDFTRKEVRHQGNLSLDSSHGEDELSLHEQIPDPRSQEDRIGLEATKQEIAELSQTMKQYGISLSDIADNSPKQDRTLEACRKVVQYAIDHPSILDDLTKTKKLPMTKLVSGSKVERKTIERHRKYILAMLLVQTNGFVIIRGHISHVLQTKGGGMV